MEMPGGMKESGRRREKRREREKKSHAFTPILNWK